MLKLLFKLTLTTTSILWMSLPLLAATNAKNDLAYAQRAFQDHLYDVAVIKLEAFLKNYPESEFRSRARLLLGQSYFFQEQYPQALKTFSPSEKTIRPEELKPAFLYWQAETLAEQNSWSKSIPIYTRISEKFPDSVWRWKAEIGKARSLFAQKKTNEALTLLEKLHTIIPPDYPELALKAELLHLKLLIAITEFEKASALLKKIAARPLSPPTSFEYDYWAGELAFHKKEWDQAKKHFDAITSDSRASPQSLVAKAWLATAKTLEQQKQHPEASAAYEKTFTLAKSKKHLETAVTGYLRTSLHSGSLTAAALKMRNWVRSQKKPSLHSIYSLAKFQLDAGNTEAAITELDHLINNHPESKIIPEAKLLLSTALLNQNQEKKAAEIINHIINSSPPLNTRHKAQAKLASLFHQQDRHQDAAKLYLAIASETPDDTRAQKAFLKTLQLYADDLQLESFEKILTRFSKKFPESEYQEQADLLHATLLLQLSQPDKTIATASHLSAHAKKLSIVAEAKALIAFAHYQKSDYPNAITFFKQIETEHPSFPRLDEITYYKIKALKQSNQLPPPQYRKQLEQMLADYPEHPKTLQIKFLLCESFYQQQIYDQAQTHFLKLASEFPETPTANQAYYFSGLSALAIAKASQSDYSTPIAILEKVLPESPFKPYAHLAQLQCYMLKGDYDGALLIADTIAKRQKKDEIWIQATLKKANCHFLLEGQKKGQYPLALKALNLIIEAPEASLPQRNEAGYLKGKILQKQGNISAALNAYMDVVYNRFLPPEISNIPQEPDYHWLTRSGLEAAQIKEDVNDIQGAVAIYRILENIGGPNRMDFRQKIEELKARHFIWEES